MNLDSDMWDPNTWNLDREPCRIYDVDGERCAIVDEEFFSRLVTINAGRLGLVTRRWAIKPPHPSRNGKKLYFVTRAGWRNGGEQFLHVAVMKLSGRKPPSPRHKLVNHIDGDEWNCRLENLEWATTVGNRRRSKQKYNRPEAP